MPSITINGAIETQKIDSAATSGLSGVYNSLAYRVHEIERHFHGREKWFGAAAVPAGETHVADRMGPSIVGFSIVSGNNAFGNWVQVLGSTDTPCKAGYKYFDAHSVLVTSANDTNPFLVQIIAGESADIVANLAAEMHSEFPFEAATNQINGGEFAIMSSRVPAGTKVWARCICIGSNAKTIVMFAGIHEYEG